MHRKPWLWLAMMLSLTLPLLAQSPDLDTKTLSARQVFENARVLFENGHRFTDVEFQALSDLRAQLLEAQDSQRVSQLDLLILAAHREAQTYDRLKADTAILEKEWSVLREAEIRRQEIALWKVTRDVSLGSFILATTTAIGLFTLADWNEVQQRNVPWNQDFHQQTQNIRIAGLISFGVMLLSLPPLLLGEANQ